MQAAVAFIRNTPHRYDAALRFWVPCGPAPAPKARPFRPMLARPYAGALAFPVLAQPKFDGVRCIARASSLFSRNGERLVSAGHVEAALAPLFDADPDLILDGELWIDGADLGRIAGLARRKEAAPELRFVAFDIASADRQADRIEALRRLLAGLDADAVVMAETTLCPDQAALDAHYAGCLRAGHEGQMIRDPGAAYRGGRGDALLKRKPIEDAEAEIVGVTVNPDDSLTLDLRTEDGATFAAPAQFKGADRRHFAFMGRALIGLSATYRYAGKHPSGASRDAAVELIHEVPRL